MNKQKFRVILFFLGGLVLAAGIYMLALSENKPSPLDDFARCLKDKGATFYGAFWCPHCQAQKKLFGKSVKLLPYVECSTADGKGQLPICTEKKVDGYPTWEFLDGSRKSGEVSLVKLAEKTSCVLPKK